MPSIILAKVALDRTKDLIKLLKGDKPHLLHAQYQDQSLTTLDKLQEIFEVKDKLPLHSKLPFTKNPHY